MGMYAFDGGHSHVLDWLKENGLPMDIVERRKVRTAPGGDLEDRYNLLGGIRRHTRAGRHGHWIRVKFPPRHR